MLISCCPNQTNIKEAFEWVCCGVALMGRPRRDQTLDIIPTNTRSMAHQVHQRSADTLIPGADASPGMDHLLNSPVAGFTGLKH